MIDLSENAESEILVSNISGYFQFFGIQVILEGIEKPIYLAMAKVLKLQIGLGECLGNLCR